MSCALGNLMTSGFIEFPAENVEAVAAEANHQRGLLHLNAKWSTSWTFQLTRLKARFDEKSDVISRAGSNPLRELDYWWSCRIAALQFKINRSAQRYFLSTSVVLATKQPFLLCFSSVNSVMNNLPDCPIKSAESSSGAKVLNLKLSYRQGKNSRRWMVEPAGKRSSPSANPGTNPRMMTFLQGQVRVIAWVSDQICCGKLGYSFAHPGRPIMIVMVCNLVDAQAVMETAVHCEEECWKQALPRGNLSTLIEQPAAAGPGKPKAERKLLQRAEWQHRVGELMNSQRMII